MMRFLLNQLNELAQKEKRRGLTAEEKIMQHDLRKKYAGLFRSSMEYVLIQTTILDPNGEDVTPKKIKQMKRLLEETANGTYE